MSHPETQSIAKKNSKSLFILSKTLTKYILSKTLLYITFALLKLEHTINTENAKFMFKFCNHLLPNSFDSHFTNLNAFNNYNLDKKFAISFFKNTWILSEEKKHFIIFAFKCGKTFQKTFDTAVFTNLKKI